jgi:NDP-sugar pyrophosphorylase family protein
MKAAVIAAGVGERIARGGIDIPKPLLRVGGRPLIARIIDAAAELGMSSVACIVNDVQPAVAQFLRSTAWPVPLQLKIKTTPSSMESLFNLEPYLRDEPFLLFTVDVVFDVAALRGFLKGAAELEQAAGVLALTDHIDDDKPLWVRVDDDLKITAMGDDATGGSYITAGFYYFQPDIFAMMVAARSRRLTALRQFLGLLLASGYPLYGLPAPKTIDVDHPEDIVKAEAFLKAIKSA